MKTTTRLIDILQTELIERGEDEFLNKIDGIDQLTYFMPQYAFIRRIMKYDTVVKEILDLIIYNDFHFDNPELDTFFKQAFINRFYMREIGSETIEVFSGYLTYYLITHEQIITDIYTNFSNLSLGVSTSDHNNSSKNSTNTGSGTLPQNQTLTDLAKDTFEYADDATFSRSNVDGKDTSKATSYNVQNMKIMMRVYDTIFRDLDKLLFKQTF